MIEENEHGNGYNNEQPTNTGDHRETVETEVPEKDPESDSKTGENNND